MKNGGWNVFLEHRNALKRWLQAGKGKGGGDKEENTQLPGGIKLGEAKSSVKFTFFI